MLTSVYKAKVAERQANFKEKTIALLQAQDFKGVVKHFRDYLNSSLGEDTDRTKMLFDLDDVFTVMSKLDMLYEGKEISEISKSTDNNVITYNATVDSFKKTDTGEKIKVGTKVATKKRHVHTEVIDIMNEPCTNLIGVPALNLAGTFYNGMYAHLSPYTSMPVSALDKPAIDIKTYYGKNSDVDRHLKLDGEIKKVFFDEIEERQRLNLSALYLFYVADNYNVGPLGLMRLDFEDWGVVDNINIVLRYQPFVNGFIDATGFLAALKEYMIGNLKKLDVEVWDECKWKIYTNVGSFKELIKKTVDGRLQQAAKVENYNKYKGVAISAAQLNEKELEKEEMLREAARAEEKARLKAEREAERKEKAVDSAKASKPKKEKSGNDTDKTYDTRHMAALKLMMDNINNNLRKHDIEPCKEIYEEMLEDAKTDKSLNNELFIEALNILLAA